MTQPSLRGLLATEVTVSRAAAGGQAQLPMPVIDAVDNSLSGRHRQLA
jgi:hypothetical protein